MSIENFPSLVDGIGQKSMANLETPKDGGVKGGKNGNGSEMSPREAQLAGMRQEGYSEAEIEQTRIFYDEIDKAASEYQSDSSGGGR